MIASNSGEDHMWLKWVWHIDAKSWLNHSRIEKNVTIQNIDNIKIVITSKFKEKLY